MAFTPSLFVLGLVAAATASSSSSYPLVVDSSRNITYEGLYRNNIEAFLGIPYGQDTSGENRFKPPQLYTPAEGSVVVAQEYGPACPQWYGANSWYPPYTLDNYTSISEDCLSLNVARPKDTSAEDKLPVIVYIYGGSLITGQASDSTILPDGLILEAAASGTPVLHVAMNYRLGVFGFAQTDQLKAEGSENGGLRDQRLALEWVRDNIALFGGDASRVTVYGQSSGGSAIGIQLLAYGGTQAVPFQQAILESGIFDNGITSTATADATALIIDAVNCTAATDTLACLRAVDTETLNTAQLDVYSTAGALWVAALDGDFLPDAPSTLVPAGAFARDVTVAMGWMADDLGSLTDPTVATPADVRAALAAWSPPLTNASLSTALALYPSSDFVAASGRSAEFFRLARMYRDAIMACQPFWFGEALAARNGVESVLLFEWNQTILEPIFEYLYDLPGVGVVHESEFAYVFGNLSHYDISGWPFDPTAADYALAGRAPRSYAAFAATGSFSGGNGTFEGWEAAFGDGADSTAKVFVVGGPEEGLSPVEGAGATAAVESQKLAERCAFWTSPDVREQTLY